VKVLCMDRLPPGIDPAPPRLTQHGDLRERRVVHGEFVAYLIAPLLDLRETLRVEGVGRGGAWEQGNGQTEERGRPRQEPRRSG
jgi:hypothetical protein